MLPNTQAQLFLRNICYTGKINKRIQYHQFSNNTRKYIIENYTSTETQSLVNWGLLGRHHQKLLWKCRATRLKFTFRWAPTNAHKFITGKLRKPLCPLYRAEAEMIAHIMKCWDA